MELALLVSNCQFCGDWGIFLYEDLWRVSCTCCACKVKRSACSRQVGWSAWLRCSLQAGQPAFELAIQQAVALILGSAEISMDHQTSEVMSGLLAGI